jgi:hypothetical protein
MLIVLATATLLATTVSLATLVALVPLTVLRQADEVGAATQRLAGAAADLAHHVGAALQSLLQETSNTSHLFLLSATILNKRASPP